MKRILEKNSIRGYQLFRYVKDKADGTTVILPNYYYRHNGKDTCTETDRLSEAKKEVLKAAGEEAERPRRKSKTVEAVTVGRLLDLVIEDYEANGHKSIRDARSTIKNSLRPFFGDMQADELDSDDTDRFVKHRESRRLRKSIRRGQISALVHFAHPGASRRPCVRSSLRWC